MANPLFTKEKSIHCALAALAAKNAISVAAIAFIARLFGECGFGPVRSLLAAGLFARLGVACEGPLKQNVLALRGLHELHSAAPAYLP